MPRGADVEDDLIQINTKADQAVKKETEERLKKAAEDARKREQELAEKNRI